MHVAHSATAGGSLFGSAGNGGDDDGDGGVGPRVVTAMHHKMGPRGKEDKNHIPDHGPERAIAR